MSGSSSRLSQLLPISLWDRTVFVKCTPTPTTFTQRRAVLRALQKDTSEGIEIFRKFKVSLYLAHCYEGCLIVNFLQRDGASFIVVTTQIEAASALINESPFERTLIVEDSTATEELKKTKWGSMYSSPRTITTPVNLLPKLRPTPITNAENELGLSHTSFTIHCFPPNRNYNHIETVMGSPLHGPWPDNGGRETFISAALRRTVPSGLMAPAFRDWVTGHQLWRDTTNPNDEVGEGALSTILGRSRAQINNRERTRARLKEKEAPEVMKSLATFAAKCNSEPYEGRQSQASPSGVNSYEFNAPTRTDTSKNHFSNAPVKKTEELLDDTAFKDLMTSPDEAATKRRSKSST